MKTFLKNLFYDSKFYKNLFKIAVPIVIQNLIGCSLNMVDTVIVGSLGEAEIASVGIANQIFILFNLIIMGIYSGCGVFISQFWGKKDVKNIRKVLGISLTCGIFISIIFTITSFFIPHEIIGIFNKDPKVIALGSDFLRVVCLSYIFTAITFSYAMASRCVEKAVIPMVVSGIALLCNTFLNYILIFGKFGMPALGVKGSALATVIARIIETIILLSYIYSTKHILSAAFNEMIDFTKKFAIRVSRTVIPVVLNELCWGLGVIVYAAVYGRIGTKAIASVQICTTIQNLFMVVTFGLANASTVMIGKKIGAGEEDEGREYAKKFSALGCAAGLIIAICLSSTAPYILKLFNVSDRVLHDSLIILYITSAVMIVRVFNIILIVGILRGGGDARYSLMAEAFTMWIIGVPLSIVGAFVFKLPVYFVVALVTVEEVLKCILGVRRLLSNKWIKNVIHSI